MSLLRRIARWVQAEENMTHIVAGNLAPGFSLKGFDGKERSLQVLLDQGPTVVAFFKVSCPVCQFTFPFLERLYRTYGGDGVTIVGISQDDAKATQKFASEYGVTFPVLMDEMGYTASSAYGLTMVPTVFLIETNGTVGLSSMGFNKADLESIGATLAERKMIAKAQLFKPDERIPAQKPG
jgi:peroxiredoxin